MTALVDSSVWIEFLRGTASSATSYVREHVGVSILTTEPIMLELLAGARQGAASTGIERLLDSQAWLRVEPGLDYRGAVDVFHATRAIGHPPRSLQDCLIAAIALRAAVLVVHRDGDFEHIASATGLVTLDLRE